MTDRSRAGRIARERGKKWERDVANYMKQWFPNAHRRGYDQAGNAVRAAGEQTPDVAGTPFWIECKSRSGNVSSRDIETWWSSIGDVSSDRLLFVKCSGQSTVWFTDDYDDDYYIHFFDLDEFAIYMDFQQLMENDNE